MRILQTVTFSAALIASGHSVVAEQMPEQFFFIVASYAAPQELIDFEGTIGGMEYLNVTGDIAQRESERCGADVFVHYTNLMTASESDWTPNLLFAYIGGYESREAVLNEAEASKCFETGYLKRGAPFIPTRIYQCATGDGIDESIDREAFCAGY